MFLICNETLFIGAIGYWPFPRSIWESRKWWNQFWSAFSSIQLIRCCMYINAASLLPSSLYTLNWGHMFAGAIKYRPSCLFVFFSGLLLLQRPVWISWEAKPNRSEAWLIWNRRCCDKKTKTLRCFTLWFASVNCSDCDRWPMIESCLLLFLFSSFTENLFTHWSCFLLEKFFVLIC